MVLRGGRGDAAEVSVFESVGVAADVDDVAVLDEPVDHGGGDDVIAEDFAPAAQGLVPVRMREARSCPEETSWKNRFAGFWFEGDIADLIEVATTVVNWVLKSAGEVNERPGPADGPTPPLRPFAASRRLTNPPAEGRSCHGSRLQTFESSSIAPSCGGGSVSVSACRCTSFQSPSSNRKIMTTRSAPLTTPRASLRLDSKRSSSKT